jgi:hypothetical protein
MEEFGRRGYGSEEPIHCARMARVSGCGKFEQGKCGVPRRLKTGKVVLCVETSVF